MKYEDGSQVKAEDVAYAIKRSFAHEELPGGPTDQNDFFKDGDTYKGPYKPGDDYAGVETPDDKTLVIKLGKPFGPAVLRLLPQFTPIPKAKDTKQNYSNHPLATGPYMFKSSPGLGADAAAQRELGRQDRPVAHQYVDGSRSTSADSVKTQQAILASRP